MQCWRTIRKLGMKKKRRLTKFYHGHIASDSKTTFQPPFQQDVVMWPSSGQMNMNQSDVQRLWNMLLKKRDRPFHLQTRARVASLEHKWKMTIEVGIAKSQESVSLSLLPLSSDYYMKREIHFYPVLAIVIFGSLLQKPSL